MLRLKINLQMRRSVRVKCPRHPRYNPERKGASGIRGSRRQCGSPVRSICGAEIDPNSAPSHLSKADTHLPTIEISIGRLLFSVKLKILPARQLLLMVKQATSNSLYNYSTFVARQVPHKLCWLRVPSVLRCDDSSAGRSRLPYRCRQLSDIPRTSTVRNLIRLLEVENGQ